MDRRWGGGVGVHCGFCADNMLLFTSHLKPIVKTPFKAFLESPEHKEAIII